jgi:Ca2+-binding RTX toxin-like protein
MIVSDGGLDLELYQGVRAGHDSDDRLIYDTSTGALYYDADGSGSKKAVQIAVLFEGENVSNLTFDDFTFG